MAYELINNGPATPQRIHALIRLMDKKTAWQKQELLDLIQPKALAPTQKIGTDVIQAAVNLGFVKVDQGELSLHDSARGLRDIEAFRQELVAKTSKARTELHTNYRFNLFTAWYTTMDETVLQISNRNLIIRFDERMPSESADRIMNTTKFAPWRTLAAFLGYGWVYGSNFVPDATVRLRPLLPELLPGDGLVPIGTFLLNLASTCPELDGGDVFRLTWQHDRPTQREARISLMVSNALRRFQQAGLISLKVIPDAGETWRLFPASGFTPDAVSHIARGGAK
jgi:hypothetical protein